MQLCRYFGRISKRCTHIPKCQSDVNAKYVLQYSTPDTDVNSLLALMLDALNKIASYLKKLADRQRWAPGISAIQGEKDFS